MQSGHPACVLLTYVFVSAYTNTNFNFGAVWEQSQRKVILFHPLINYEFVNAQEERVNQEDMTGYIGTCFEAWDQS